jgi:hypothetical protein
VSWRLIDDGVDAQMGMLEPEIVQIEPILRSELMMPDGRTLYERVRDPQFRLPPATERESDDDSTTPPSIPRTI